MADGRFPTASIESGNSFCKKRQLMKWLDEEKFSSIERILQGFEGVGYICTKKIATTLYLAYHLGKPILVEGPAGVGKTDLGKSAAHYLDVSLIRLQCYEGLDESKALYEWKYGKQLLYTQILKDKLNDLIQKSDGLTESIEKLHQHDDIFFSSPLRPFCLKSSPIFKFPCQRSALFPPYLNHLCS
jgi:hypothetical protein